MTPSIFTSVFAFVQDERDICLPPVSFHDDSNCQGWITHKRRIQTELGRSGIPSVSHLLFCKCGLLTEKSFQLATLTANFIRASPTYQRRQAQAAAASLRLSPDQVYDSPVHFYYDISEFPQFLGEENRPSGEAFKRGQFKDPQDFIKKSISDSQQIRFHQCYFNPISCFR